jgi:hypothetical protein
MQVRTAASACAIIREPCKDGSRGARAFRLLRAWFRWLPCIRRPDCSTGAARPGESARSPWSRSRARARWRSGLSGVSSAICPSSAVIARCTCRLGGVIPFSVRRVVPPCIPPLPHQRVGRARHAAGQGDCGLPRASCGAGSATAGRPRSRPVMRPVMPPVLRAGAGFHADQTGGRRRQTSSIRLRRS